MARLDQPVKPREILLAVGVLLFLAVFLAIAFNRVVQRGGTLDPIEAAPDELRLATADASIYLPDLRGIPANFVSEPVVTSTNQDIVTQLGNDGDLSGNLTYWGRETGSSQQHIDPDTCTDKEDLTRISTQVVLMQSREGARQYREWLEERALDSPSTIDFDNRDELGNGLATRQTFRRFNDACDPAKELIGMTFRWQRANAIGVVSIVAHVNVDQAYISSHGLLVAQQIDQRLIDAPKE